GVASVTEDQRKASGLPARLASAFHPECTSAAVSTSASAVPDISGSPRPVPAKRSRAPDRQVVEGGDGIRLGPQPGLACPGARVVMVQEQSAVEPALQMITDGEDAERVPLAERRGLHVGRGELTTSAVVVIEAEVVLEGVGADDVIPAAVEADHDAPRRILAARDPPVTPPDPPPR